MSVYEQSYSRQESDTTHQADEHSIGLLTISFVYSLREMTTAQFNEITSYIEEGKEVRVSVDRRDLNRKRIGSTQKWADDRSALEARDSFQIGNDEIGGGIQGYLEYDKNKNRFYIIIGDGNHRAAVRLIHGENARVKICATRIVDKDSQEKIKGRFGFNSVFSKVRAILNTNE